MNRKTAKLQLEENVPKCLIRVFNRMNKDFDKVDPGDVFNFFFFRLIKSFT